MSENTTVLCTFLQNEFTKGKFVNVSLWEVDAVLGRNFEFTDKDRNDGFDFLKREPTTWTSMCTHAKHQKVLTDLGGLTVKAYVAERLERVVIGLLVLLNFCAAVVVPLVDNDILSGSNDDAVAKSNRLCTGVTMGKSKVVVSQTHRFAAQTVQLDQAADNVESKEGGDILC